MRDYIYVEDIAEACVAVSNYVDNDGRSLNLGSGISTKLIDVSRLIVGICDAGEMVHSDWPKEYSKIEPRDYFADISEICRLYEWRPKTSLKEGIRRTVEVIREFKNAKDS